MKEYKDNIKLITLKKNSSSFPNQKILSSKDSEEFIRKFYSDDIGIFESFFILLLNGANKTLGYAKISQGGVCGTVVDKVIIAKYVVDTLATSVILCHNHPSGNTTPSSQDLEITNGIKAALALFGCTVLDHLILTEESYLSMADEGMMN